MSRQQAMQFMYDHSPVNISQHVNKPIKQQNLIRGLKLVPKLVAGPVPFMLHAFIIQPLKYAVYDYVSDTLNPQSPAVVVDTYTESILAEVMSSQQTESKPESAPRFIRPKKKKKLLYK